MTQHDEYNQNVKTSLEKLIRCFEFGLLDTDSLNVFFEHLFFTQMSEEKTFRKMLKVSLIANLMHEEYFSYKVKLLRYELSIS